jgi:hypothetical protein
VLAKNSGKIEREKEAPGAGRAREGDPRSFRCASTRIRVLRTRPVCRCGPALHLVQASPPSLRATFRHYMTRLATLCLMVSSSCPSSSRCRAAPLKKSPFARQQGKRLHTRRCARGATGLRSRVAASARRCAASRLISAYSLERSSPLPLGALPRRRPQVLSPCPPTWTLMHGSTSETTARTTAGPPPTRWLIAALTHWPRPQPAPLLSPLKAQRGKSPRQSTQRSLPASRPRSQRPGASDSCPIIQRSRPLATFQR